MRKAVYLAAALLVCSAMVFAQESSSSSSTQSGSQATSQSGTSGASAQTGTAADQNSMSGQTFQGCLMGSSGNYTLTDATGTSWKLQGEDSQLSSNVNKQVEVMGTPGASASASTSGPGSAGSASTGSEGSAGSQGGATAEASASKTLNVTSVHKIADSCEGGEQKPQ